MVVPTVTNITGQSPIDWPEAFLQAWPLDEIGARQAEAIDKLTRVRQLIDPGDALDVDSTSPEQPPGKEHRNGMAASDPDNQVDLPACQQIDRLDERPQERIDAPEGGSTGHCRKGWN
jgi:hypothetical protein